MSRRLVDRFHVGQRVEIKTVTDRWAPAVILELAHPGVWVLDSSGKPWFVTNSRHIRTRHDEA